MAILSPKLRSADFGTAGSGIAFWCPGCNEPHSIRTEGSGGQFNQAKWQWDGNADLPTISPSILIRVNFLPEDGGPIVCHSFVRAGVLEYLDDCTHPMRGQKIPIPDWPEFSQTFASE